MSKRLLDFFFAFLGLLLLSPLLICLGVLVRAKMGSPILFRQTRPGRGGKPFGMLKFRTMTDARDADGQLLPDELRLNAFGKWLRSTSLDELPELWNILNGDMSIVGPRPLLMQYLPLYSAEQMRRHEVRPGLTGWAQVNGRNNLSWDDRFKLDVWYVDHRSLLLDLKVIFKTFQIVFRRQGINQAGEATMPAFVGSPSRRCHEEIPSGEQ